MPSQSGPRHDRDAAHGKDALGGLVGAGPSKVGVDGAMRARDVSQPTSDDLAAAERDLVLRHAARHVETRPLPEGIAPAHLPPERTGSPPPRPKPNRPLPRPPQRRPGQRPAGNGGSTPDAS